MSTYTLRHANPAKTRCDAVVIAVVQTSKGLMVAPGGEEVAAAYGRTFRPLLASLGFAGKVGEVAKVPTGKRIGSPLLVVHGSDDSLIRPTLGRQLYEAAREPKQFVLVEGGSHHNTNAVGQGQYREALNELFGL